MHATLNKVTFTFLALVLFVCATAHAQVSDDFSASTLDTGTWTLVDPLGGSNAAIVDGRVILSVVGGKAHDLWRDGNYAVRLVQDVADVDFELEAKFESVPTVGFQLQGLLIESSPGNYQRLDFYTTGDGQLRLFNASFVNDAPKIRSNLVLPAPGAELWLRVTRSGNTWTTWYSLDGTQWTQAAQYDMAVAVSKVGVYGGNAGSPAPAFDAVVDYVFETASPIVPEDGGVNDVTPPTISDVTVTPAMTAASVAWTTDELTQAQIDFGATPALELGSRTRDTLSTDHVLALDDLSSAMQYYFQITATDATGNVATSSLDSFTTVNAVNLPPTIVLTLPPSGSTFETGEIVTLSADAGDADGTVTQVEFLVDDVVVGTDTTAPYAADWPASAPGTYAVLARVTDDDGAQSLSGVATIGVSDPIPVGSPIQSDDFSQPILNTEIWSFVDPVGGSSYTLENGLLRLAVNGDAEHNLWRSGNDAVRIMQPAPDEDFELEVKFESVPEELFQMQGLLVEESSGNYIRLDYFSQGDGTLRLFCASFVNDDPTIRSNIVIDTAATLWLRITRTGSNWTGSTSTDGVNFTPVVNFSHTMQVARAGVFGGNAGSPTPPFDVLVDYAFETAAPIDPEDGGITDDVPPVVTTVSVVPNVNQATVQWTTNELATSRVDYGPTANLELGFVETSGYRTTHELVIPGLDADTTYFYRIVTEDPRGNVTSVPAAQFTTLETVNLPPTISLDSPTDGAPFDIGAAIPLTATAGDTDGTVTQVEFLVDDTVVVVDAEAPFDTTWTAPAMGDYVVTARATDDGSATTISQPATVLVRDLSSPAVVSDDFSAATLDSSLWTFADPVGGSSLSISYGVLSLDVIGGTDHDLWVGGNESVRILQPSVDTDFEIEAKFQSIPSIAYQLQGIMAEQVDGTYVRLDHYFGPDGELHLFCASFVNDNPTIRGDMIVQAGPEGLWMRMRRTGNTWEVFHSADGIDFTRMTTFDLSMVVNRVGPYAGNASGGSGPAPAYTAELDYFFETASPIVPEDDGIVDDDGPIVSNRQLVPATTSATLTFATDENAIASVAYGVTDTLELGTVATSIFTRDHTLVIDGLDLLTDYNYRLTVEDALGNVTVDSVLGSFTTLDIPNELPTVTLDSPAAGALVRVGDPVELAATAGDNDGNVVEVEFVIDDTVVATDTTAPYSFTWIADAAGTRSLVARARDDDGGTTDSAPVNLSVLTVGASAALVSDDFNGDRLDPATWTFRSPLGGGQVYAADGRMVLEVPAGEAHDLWTNQNGVLTAVQSAPDIDLAFQARFESVPSLATQVQGLLVQSSPDSLVRFDVFHDGSGLYAFAAMIDDGDATPFFGPVSIPGTVDEITLRLERSGTTWTAGYSVNGVDFTLAGSFERTLPVNAVGVFGGNADPDDTALLSPAFDVIVDSFVDLGAPLFFEDQGPRTTLSVTAGDTFTTGTSTDLSVAFEGTPGEINALASLELFVDDLLFASGTEDTLVAAWTPARGVYRVVARATDAFGFMTTSAPTTVTVHDASEDPSDVPTGIEPTLDVTPAAVSNLTTDVRDGSGEIALSFVTDENATATVEYGPDANFGDQVGPTALGTQHDVLIGNLTANELVFYRVTITDEAGNVSKVRTAARRLTNGPVIDVWYGLQQRVGHLGDVQYDHNVLGKISNWERLVAMEYRLNGGPAVEMTVGGRGDGFGDTKRLGQNGDFNCDIPVLDLLTGANIVTLTATDLDGNQSIVDVTVTRETGGSTPRNQTIVWDDVTDITDVGTPVDGNWLKTEDGLRTVETGYDRLFLVGERDWQDYDVLVPVTIHRIDPPGPQSNRAAVGLLLRFQGHVNGTFPGGFDFGTYQPKYGYLPLGGIGWLRFRRLNQLDRPSVDWFSGDSNDTIEFFRYDVVEGGTYMMRMRCETLPDTVEGEGVTRYSYKVWDQGTPEPQDWSFVYDQISALALRTGAFSLIAHHVDATYGDVTITELTPPAAMMAGDVDGDATITMDDARLVLDHVVGREPLDGPVASRADIGGSRGLDAHDAALISHVARGHSLREIVPVQRATMPSPSWGEATADGDDFVLPIEIPAGTDLRSWSFTVTGAGLGARVLGVEHEIEGDAQFAWRAQGDELRIAYAAAAPVTTEGTLVRVVLEVGDRFEHPTIEASARLDGGDEIALGSQVLAVVPRVHSLRENYPNPFNPQTTIEFGLPQSARTRLTVFDVRGRRVTTLVDEALDAGHHRVVWDGTDGNGSRVASGVYFYRLDAPGFASQKKMLLLK